VLPRVKDVSKTKEKAKPESLDEDDEGIAVDTVPSEYPESTVNKMVSDNGAKVFSIRSLKPFSSGGREPDPRGGCRSVVGGGGGGGGGGDANPT
jgi:hypothetical protein